MPDQQGFYSKLEEVVSAKLPKSATPQQILATVDPAKGSGVKAEELKWTGFAQAVERIAKENGGKVPKEKLIEHLQNESRVRFDENTLSGGIVWTVGDQGHTEQYTDLKSALNAKKAVEDFWAEEIAKGWDVSESDDGYIIVDQFDDPIGIQRSDSGRAVWEPSVYDSEKEAIDAIKEGANELAKSNVYWAESSLGETLYSEYQLPEGKNYREIVLTADTGSSYTSSHFKDIPNYVAHMRVNERTDEGGKPGLFIEEIQSDRHQKAREIGYAQTKKQMQARLDELLAVPAKNRTISQNDEINALSSNINSRTGGQTGIPDAPFRKDWSLQMFKRGLRDAVSSGKEWIGWTTGETQAARYDLSQQVDYIDYRMVGPDKYDVGVVGKNGTDLFSEEGINKSRISDVLGKEIADKMAKGEGQSGGGRMTLRGVDLKVGGEGIKGFYDKILPAEVQKYVKQWGGEVKKSNSSIKEAPIWRVDITPQMRESVQKTGQPRFMPSILTPDPAIPGAFSASGGFRVLPGKTGGRLRVYGPSGALVGIVGSQDEAQRLIRRKTTNN